MEFAALLPTPFGVLPAMGDTAYANPAPWSLLRRLSHAGIESPSALYVLSCGQQGARPPDLNAFPASGVTIVRPSYADDGPWEEDLHLLVDMGPSRRVHGHDDAMNVLLSAFGQQLLADSGGPYQYGIPERQEFVAAAAHNTVVVDGARYVAGDVTIDLIDDNPAFSVVEGWHEKSPGVRHRRTVMLLKPNVIVIVDRLSAIDGKRHDFELLYHLDPAASVSRSKAGALVQVREAAMGITVAGSRDLIAREREGEEDPLVGWVTNRHARRIVAPVLSYSETGRAEWYVTAIAPADVSRAVVPEVVATRRDGAITVGLSIGDDAWRLVFSVGTVPHVEWAGIGAGATVE